MFVTTCCIYKSTSNIYLFKNCKEKCTFSTRPRVFRDQISQEILVEIVIFFSFQKFTFQASRDPNSTPKTRTKQSLLGLEYFIFWPFYFEHLRSTMYGSWSCSGLENLHFWPDKETTMYRQFHLQKTIELYCDLWKLFYCKWTEIIVEIELIWFWLANVLFLLSD